jgi:Fic family protein
MDGNGRTSRLLSTLYLYGAGYDFKRLFTLSEYYDRDRAAFYRAIQSVREEDLDLTRWLEYFVDGLATQLDEVKARGAAAIRAGVVATAYRLSARRSVILAELLAARSVTIGGLEGLFPGIDRRTLQRDLKVLLEKGLIREVGSGRTDPNRSYVPAEL